MKITTLKPLQSVMQNFGSRHNYFGWPTVARLKNGKIAAVASGFRLDHVCPFGKTVISYSEDEGESYTLPAPVIDTTLDDRDGGIMAFGKSGVIVTSFNNKIAFQRNYCQYTPATAAYRNAYLDLLTEDDEKRDLGATFRISQDNGITFSQIYKSPITSPHGPCELDNGDVIWVGTAFGGTGIYAYLINTDNGETKEISRIPDLDSTVMMCEPHAIGLGNGKVLCHIRVQNTSGEKVFTTYQTISNDYGKSWSTPKRVLDLCGGAPAHIMKHSSGVLIATYSYREAPYGIKAMFSEDEGETWETDFDIYVNGVSLDIGYPSSIELSDGSILTLFYAHKNNSEPATILQQIWQFDKK